MKFKKSAWSAFQRGTTSTQLKEAAKDKADYFLLWLLISAAVFYFLPGQWAIGPALLAALYGAQSFDASKLAPEIEVLERMLGKTTGI